MEANPKTEALAVAHNALIAGITALIETNGWEAHLKAQSAFHRYSFGNVLWLYAQAAERGVTPTRFAGFNTWKKVKRFVKKGEKGFKVLAPVMVKKTRETESGEKDSWRLCGFKVVTTFEKSQTDGEEIPEIVTKLEGTSEEAEATYAKVAAFATKRGWTVEKGSTGSANGYADVLAKRIVVSETLSGLQSLKTLTHEVAHSMMHADDLGSHGAEEREVEAESVAYVVLNALGFNSADYSFGYVAHWSKGDVELVKKTGERVQRTAKTLLDALGLDGKEEEAA